MNWVDYTITQVGPHFTIKGEWAGEVMGWSKDGDQSKKKENILYQPGDRFIVNEAGWLIRMNPEDIEERKAQEE